MSNGNGATNGRELTPQDLRVMRWVGLVGGLLLIAFGVLHRAVSPEMTDPPGARLFMIALCFGLLGISYVYRGVHFAKLVYAAFYIVTGWIIWLASANGLSGDYALSLFLVIAAVCMGFRSEPALAAYCAVIPLATAAAAFSATEPALNPLLFTAQVAGIAVISFLLVGSRLRMQQELLEQQRSMGTLLGNLPGMAYRCRQDVQWTMELVSDGCEELTGYTPAALLQNAEVAFADLIVEEDRERVAAEVDAAMARGAPFQLEYRLRTRTGELKWVSEQGLAVEAQGGPALEGFIRDITGQKASVEALKRHARESALLVQVFRLCALETERRAIVQGVADALHRFFDAWSLGVFFLDDAGERLVLEGLSLTERAQRYEPFVQEEWGWLNTAGDQPVAVALRERRRFCSDPDDELLHPKTRAFLQAAGIRRFYVEPIWVGSEAVGAATVGVGRVDLEEDDWRLLAFALSHVALTLQANRLSEMRQRALSELQTLSAAIEKLPDAVVILNPDHKVRAVNTAWEALCGSAAAEHVGRALPPACDTADVPALAVEAGGWSGERTLKRGDGSSVPISVSASPVHDDLGGLTAVLMIARDLSVEKQQQADVLRASRLAAIGELAAGVAHEVNNPLGAISMTAELLLAEALPQATRDDVATILSEARRAGAIVRNLLAFARQDAGSKRVVHLSDVIRGIEQLKKYELVAAGVELVSEVHPDAQPVVGDPQQLQQVVHNLVTNAQQAMAPDRGGRIRIIVRASQDMTDLVVEDTGPGIGDEILPRVFMPFFTTKPFGEGTGLGLAISYGIVREHRGHIVAANWGVPRVDGGATGQGGAQFVIRLPAAAEVDEPALPAGEPVRTSEQAAAAGQPKRSALVVDDEPGIARTLQRFLERDGWSVELAGSAEAAVAQLGAVRYDLLLSDLHMPGMGGCGLYDHLLDNAREQLPSLVFMSGDVVSPDTDAFLRRTGRPILSKPFDLDELRAVAAAVLAEAAGS